MSIQLVIINPTYTDSCTLTSYATALSNMLTIVTKAATTTSCTIILILLGIVLRISDIIRLLNAVIIVTDSPMTMAGLSCEVTARAEQIPRICIVIGLSFPSGAVRTSLFSVENNLAIFLVY